MNLLESLWFGNACPCDQMGRDGLESLCRWEDALRASLSPEQWKLFLQYEAAQNQQAAGLEGRIFASGVRFGVRFLLECLNP